MILIFAFVILFETVHILYYVQKFSLAGKQVPIIFRNIIGTKMCLLPFTVWVQARL